MDNNAEGFVKPLTGEEVDINKSFKPRFDVLLYSIIDNNFDEFLRLIDIENIDQKTPGDICNPLMK